MSTIHQQTSEAMICNAFTVNRSCMTHSRAAPSKLGPADGVGRFEDVMRGLRAFECRAGRALVGQKQPAVEVAEHTETERTERRE